MGKSLLTLDFNGLKAGFSAASIGAKGFAVALASTGIGLIVPLVSELVANFTNLKAAGGAIGKVFSGIGSIIDTVMDKFRYFSDLILGTSLQAEHADEKTAENLEKQGKAYEAASNIRKQYSDQAVAAARARGASEDEISAIIIKSARAQVKAAGEIIGSQGEIISAMEQRILMGEKLSDADQKTYDTLKAAQNDQIKANNVITAQQKADSDRRKAAYDERVKASQDDLITSKENAVRRLELDKASDEEITKARILAIETRAAVEIQRAGKNAAAIESIRLKAEENTQKELDNLRNKQLNDYLNDFKSAQDKLANTREIELFKTADPEKRIQIEKKTADKLYALELERLEKVRQAGIESTKEGTQERAAVEKAYIDGTTDAEKTAYKNLNDEILKQSDDTINKLGEQTQDGIDKLKKELDSDPVEVNFLNFGFKLADLKANVDKQKQIVLDGFNSQKDELDRQQKEGIISAEEYANKLNDITKEKTEKEISIEEDAAAKRQEIAQAAMESGVAAAQAAVSVITELGAIRDEQRQAEIDREREDLQTSYDERKAIIEKTITDEEKKTQALSALDNEFANKSKKLDAQDLALKKQAIKRERNAAIATIILSNATALANAVAAATKDSTASPPFASIAVLAATLAAMGVSIGLTIAKAKAALNQADSAAGELGGGGGGGNFPTQDVPTVGGGSSGATPNTQQQFGINQIVQDGESQSGSGIVINPVVSVVDIINAQDRVNVTETRNTFSAE